MKASILKSDVLIVGSGLAGLHLAYQLSDAYQVNLITKDSIDVSSTYYAQGGIAASVLPQDSVEQHVHDTLAVGDGLCNRKVVEKICSKASDSIKDLLYMGVNFTYQTQQKSKKTKLENLNLYLEGGHSFHRIIHSKDQTGLSIIQSLKYKISQKKNIRIFENTIAIELLHNNHVNIHKRICHGVLVWDENHLCKKIFLAHVIVMATGGFSWIYSKTTNPHVSTGNGIVLGAMSGLPLSNLEFVQFHPTSFFHPQNQSFLLSEAVRGMGGQLLSPIDKKTFMKNYHPSGDLASRDIVSRAIAHETIKNKIPYVLLDVTHIPCQKMMQNFPHILQKCKAFGYNILTEPIPVAPSAHYCCGGIKANVDGSTMIKNLFYIGESASTGFHGANRLASNSLLESIVMSGLCYQKINTMNIKERRITTQSLEEHLKIERLFEVSQVKTMIQQIRQIMWNYCGIIRSDEQLSQAIQEIEKIKLVTNKKYSKNTVSKELIELRHMIIIAKNTLKSALIRQDSRGTHYKIHHRSKAKEKFALKEISYSLITILFYLFIF